MIDRVVWKMKRSIFLLMVRMSNGLFGCDLTYRSRVANVTLGLFQLLYARISPAYYRQARFERQNPDAPWLVPDAIRQIEQFLKPHHVGFEWGSGRSTLWFARRTFHITSVEGRRDWFEKISRQIAIEGLQEKISLQLQEVTAEYDFLPHEIDRYARAIDHIKDESLDFIIVDGHFRVPCLERIGNKLRSGGMLVVDNSDVIPDSALELFGCSQRISYSNGISETTLMFRP